MKLVFFQVLGVVLAGDHTGCGTADCSLDDESSLIQALNTVAVRTDHSLVQSSESKTDKRKAYVNRLFQTAQDMLKESVTPTVVRFVADVLETLESTVMPAIQDEHDMDQRMMNTLWIPVNASVTSAATYSGAIHNYTTMSQSASSNHVTCRDGENTHCVIITDCEERLDVAYGHHEMCEQEIDDIQDLISADWCGSSVDKMELVFRNAARPRLARYLAKEIECDELRAIWTTITEECEAAHVAHQLKRGSCDEAQGTLETSVCSWATEVEEARRVVLQAYTAAVDAYTIAMQDVEAEEADRKVEFSTLEITKCLLEQIHVATATEEPCDESTILPVEQVNEQLQRCHELVVDTGHLDLDYHTIPGAPDLPGVPVFPCVEEFTSAQYGEMPQTNMCAGPAVCNSCAALAEHITVDGCTTAGDTHVREVRDVTDLANVRCCSMDGTSCATEGLPGGCQEGKSFFEAQMICSDAEMRLCSENEIESLLCCGTGCGYDGHKVWTSTDSIPDSLRERGWDHVNDWMTRH